MSCYYFDREFYRKCFVKKFRESLRHFCTCTMYHKQSLLKASSNNLHNETSGLYYKHMTIVNYASSFVNKLKTLHTDDARVVIYDRRVFIVQATGVVAKWKNNPFLLLRLRVRI
jgi:hypothetical protein